MGKQSKGEVLSGENGGRRTPAEMEQIAKEHPEMFEDVFKRLEEEEKRYTEKLKLVRKYNPPVFGVTAFLFQKLTNEQIVEIGERYRAKGSYRYVDLLTELLTITGHEKCVGDGSSVAKEFTLVDLGNVEMYLNQYREEEVKSWIEALSDGGERLQETIKELEKKVSNRTKAVNDLRKIVKSLKHLQKFDKRKYDIRVFEEANDLHRRSKGYDQHYGRCLLIILKKRGIANDEFESTSDFLNWQNAYKKHRSAGNQVKSKAPKK